ncbi:phage baseplate assembly protein V, partial [Prevotella melaninogenica]|uniref:phage baseplate assembly protein V n=3 Tax=Prevotella melaninogenica TaxID=28132 RepID=UPI0021519B0C
AFRASLGMFSKPARQHALPRISNETELINYMGRKQAAETAETHYITAESQVPTLRVGSVISLYSSFLERVGNISKESLGDFIIIEITHEVSQGSYYKNRFKAIPATIKALPSPKVRMPLAETQMATVLSNADPQGKGRVRVRMNWQTDGMQTGWVRVMTPDGGSSSDVKSNRGFVFIPEVGDQVLLGFRHGDPARPYVMGSLFNGTTGGGGGQGNNCKSLTTRSGSSLKLDDSAGSVTLHDKGGVSMNFDGAGNATTNAKSSNFVNAGTNNVINVGNGSSVISSDSDGNITLKGNTAITLVVGDNQVKVCTEGIFINGKQQVVIGTDETMSLQAKQDMTMSSKTNLNMSGKTTATLGSKDISITGGSKVVVDGPDVNINS